MDSERHDLRLATGIGGIDTILRGGLFKGGIYILKGPPGAGKTILANQIAFNHVRQGGHALYLTLLAETHARMVASLSSLKFFDAGQIGTSITYVSGFRTMEQAGLDGLLQLLRQEVRARKTTFLVLDGLVTAAVIAGSDLAFKRFIHELQALADLVGCTTLMLTSMGSDGRVMPEHTMVDGIVELSDEHFGLRNIRHIEVRKFRGAGHQRGRHVFTITDAGITVFPRLENSTTEGRHQRQQPPRRLSLGSPELDAMLGGGLPVGTSSLVMGTPGSGKTSFALQFLSEGVQSGETVAYYGFYEQPPFLERIAEGIGKPLSGKGKFIGIWDPPIEVLIDEAADRILRLVDTEKPSRLVIDGLNGFEISNVHGDRIPSFMAALMHELRCRGVTIVMTYEITQLFAPELDIPLQGVSAITDNLLLLRNTELDSRWVKLITLLKVRETQHDTAIRELAITPNGLQVREIPERHEQLLTGMGHPAASPARTSKARRSQ